MGRKRRNPVGRTPPPGFIKGEHYHNPDDSSVFYPVKTFKKALHERGAINPKKRKRRVRVAKNPVPAWFIHIQKHGRGPVQVWNGKSFSNRPDAKPHPFASSAAAMQKARWLLGKYHRLMSPYKIWVSDMFYGASHEKTRVNPKRRVNPETREQLDAAAQKLEDFTGHKATHVEKVRARSDDKTGLVVGELDLIGYRVAREGIDNGRMTRFAHKFRKGSRPLLAASTDGKQLHIVGGQYEFTEAGIEDR